MRFRVLLAFLALAAPAGSRAAEPPRHEYLEFVRARADALRARDEPPATPEAWAARRAALRAALLDAWGGFPAEACPLDPKAFGELKREGYRVEKLTFQTFPGVRMTANAYVPDRPGKLPALLMVHGHWRGAKQDPTVQARCIGAAKLGFFVLAVDALGAGERAVGEALGEYHGDLTAATLLPLGRPLSGLQVYENLRAVDYLRSRPEVDGERIGVTGASGGGNQTMYAAGWDDRHRAAVPVCSVGNYRAYLGTACCLCEVVPGALRFTEEGDALGLVAPRGLMVVNATRDGVQFSVAEAKKSVARAETAFKLLDRPANVRHAVFESPHDYSRPMREAMYGWMALHLKGEGDGSPIPEPKVEPEPPESLRCYPGETRPKDFATLPRFAAGEARKLLAARPAPATAAGWAKESEARRTALVEEVLGGFPAAGPDAEKGVPEGDRLLHFRPEPGLNLTASVEPGKGADAPLVLVLNLEGGEVAASGAIAAEARKAGLRVATLDLRATGKLAWPGDKSSRSKDHTSAEWGLWLGRPLLGQWTVDVRRLLGALEAGGQLPKDVTVVGEGPAGLVALCAAATDPRISAVAAVGTLASYVADVPYVGQRLGTMAPGILRHVGDVPHLAALALPRRVVVAGGVGAGGKPLTAEQLTAAYEPATKVAGLLGASGSLAVTAEAGAAEVLRALRRP